MPDIPFDVTVGADDADDAPMAVKADLTADPTDRTTVLRWAMGDSVRLRQRPTYLKTADPMPMLRPPDLIGVDEVGQVVELRALGQVAVRFRRGSFLMPAVSLEAASSEGVRSGEVSPVEGAS
ncbi:MAG: NAD(P)H dehydrogenase assembly family protein [Cyanobacteriota bacterium]|nr:NAD(P)H dehydrogenase assembly family protein [Cyanobacteriota bacterium]